MKDSELNPTHLTPPRPKLAPDANRWAGRDDTVPSAKIDWAAWIRAYERRRLRDA